MPEMPTILPIAEITERLHGDVVKVLRATRTSSLLIILIDDHARDAMFAEIMRAVPSQFKDREWQWLGRTVVEEIDRRIPIPT